MLRHERRLLVVSLLVGAAITLLVITADASGLLAPAENFLYDIRARTCQHFTPPPTTQLVHLDIDDTALDVMGAWPWPRRKMAQIFDEIALAGPKAVEMDVLYSEPQLVQHEPRGDGTYETIDNDADLAAAMKRLGNVIVPATLEPVPTELPLYAAIVEEMRGDLEQDPPAIADKLTARGFKIPDTGLGDQFFLARRQAIMQRLAAMNAGPQMTFAQIRAKLIPRTPEDVHPGVENVLQEQWAKYLAIREFSDRYALPAPPGMRKSVNERIQIPPLQQYSAAASGGAFVDYTKFGSAVIRSLPLLLEQDGRVYPQMGLALACRMLDADMTRMRVVGGDLIVPRALGAPDLIVPLAPPRLSTTGSLYASLVDIPWFGGTQWETMYDFPHHKNSSQHIPMNEVWQAYNANRKILQNIQLADEATQEVLRNLDPAAFKKFSTTGLAPDDFEARVPRIRAVLKDAEPYVQEFAKGKLSDIPKEWESFLPSIRAMKQLLELTPPLLRERTEFRSSLKKSLEGKAVLVGWTATSAIADFVPTSLNEKCPGVVVHGVIFNGIMTGEMWRQAPWWVAAIAAALLGLITALAVGYLSPVRALAVAGALVLGYALLNGYVIFDYGNRIVGAAAPLTAVGFVWAGCTLAVVMAEAAERRRITGRFRNYVDPKLVSYVLENPDFTFDGEKREMTVVFTDLAGFTSISEKLGEKVVPMLNDLLGELVPVIREHHSGLVNKFLGDGIMFFYNAPKKDPLHADDAVATVLDMHKTIEKFNARIKLQGLPEVGLRAGISSGEMIVGDAGGAGATDYTVLGDSVNLGARLEAANKAVGTHTLMNNRAAELLDGRFLIRPVGRLRVVGKEEAIMCYEPICVAESATPAQNELAAVTSMLVDSFITRRFEDCLRYADQLEATFGPAKLAALYRVQCERCLREPPGDDFDGRIVLTEK